jgi:alpha-galactosidase
MFSSSLAWFEVQNYPALAFRQVSKLIKVWKQHRDAIFAGSIIPIGSQPDGTSWTGFCSQSNDGKSAYVLIFRELNKEAEHEFELPIRFKEKLTVKKLAGNGTAKLRNQTLLVKIPNHLNYFFGKIN